MTKKTFIKKAIEGGWRIDGQVPKLSEYEVNFVDMSFATTDDERGWTIEHILLCPEAWRAVGKVNGWTEVQTDIFTRSFPHFEWRYRFHCFVDALCDGKVLEEALQEAMV